MHLSTSISKKQIYLRKHTLNFIKKLGDFWREKGGHVSMATKISTNENMVDYCITHKSNKAVQVLGKSETMRAKLV